MESITLISVILAGPVGLTLMFLVMRFLFRGSVLYKIGISTGTAIILVAFLSGMVAKLTPVHNVWVFPLQVIIAVLAYVYVARVIKAPLLQIIELIKKVSSGSLNNSVDDSVIAKKDEIGEIARSMLQLQKDLKGKAAFAIKIGEGTFDDSFQKLSDEDELGEALLHMQNSLKQAREEDMKRKTQDQQRNWITEGQAKFADILRQNYDNEQELSFSIISNLVKYMNVNQGGLFIVNEETSGDKFLELMACYAFDRRKYLEKRVEIGEGLLGTCYLEGETTYIKQVPQDYIRITSGLGDENPGALLLVPLKLNEEIYGVMEIASFRPFHKHEIEFAERVGEIIASTISGLKINNRTATLLEKSQQQAEEMRAQEEEMRQNMEELSATQEAMAEKDRENQKKIEELEKLNVSLLEEIRQLKGKG